MAITLNNLKKVHLVGIKGTGMSALALMLRTLGIRVTGSDSSDSFLLLDQAIFTRAGIKITDTFEAKNLAEDADAVIASTSHLTKNPEVNKAKKLKIPVLTYPQAVALLTQEFKTVAVCGSHGKTTTTNLLAHVMAATKTPMIALAGPTSPQVLGELSPEPQYFVLEADEYENKLKQYSPFGVILTNIDYDHPDFFKTKASYIKVFQDFVKSIPKEGFLVYCADDANAREVATKAKCKTIGYGFEEGTYKIRAVSNHEPGSPFAIHNTGVHGIYRTTLLGQHNVLNSSAVILAIEQLGIKSDLSAQAGKIQDALMSFRGSPRRLEKVSEEPLIFDDYGHHPAEIEATLKAVKDAYPDKKIWTVFHPHTYTRTKTFLKEFGKAFKNSDMTIVIDIFESRESGKKKDITSKNVAAEIKKNKGKVEYIPTMEEAAKFLKGKLKSNVLLLTIGAGDVWKLHKMLK